MTFMPISTARDEFSATAGSAARGHGYRVSCEAALDPAVAAELWRDAANPLVFNHPAWWAAAIHSFGAERPLSVISVRQGTATVALWPLWRKRLGAREGLARIIEPVGARVTDYCVPLLRKGHDAATLIELIVQQACALLDAQTMLLWPKAPTGQVDPAAIEALARRHRLLIAAIDHPCPAMTLPATFEQLEKRWSKSHRGDIRRQIKRLSLAGTLELVPARSRDEIAAMLPRLYAMHTANWHARSGATELQAGPMTAFVDRLAADLPLDMIDATQVRIGGAAISYHFGFRHGRTLSWYKPTFDITWASYAPGKVHIALAARQAIADGFDRIDFMQGNEPYKLQWSDLTTATRSFALARPMAYPIWLWNTAVRKFAAEYRT
jgi:CelD/BcsL family acetyltransferase involved in cellulose biosynthesis